MEVDVLLLINKCIYYSLVNISAWFDNIFEIVFAVF